MNPQERREEVRKKNERGEAWREEARGAGADFNPVASGLRQFGFQPRLESQRPASQKNLNRNRGGKSLSEGEWTSLSASSPFRAQVPGHRSVVFSTRESLLLHSGKRTELESFPFSTSDRARSKKWLRSLPTGKNLVSKLVNLELRLFFEYSGWAVFLSPETPAGCCIYIYLVAHLKGKGEQ